MTKYTLVELIIILEHLEYKYIDNGKEICNGLRIYVLVYIDAVQKYEEVIKVMLFYCA